MDTDGVIQLFGLLVLVMLSAFFSSAETSLTTVNRVRLRALADDGNKRAEKALNVLDKYGKIKENLDFAIGKNTQSMFDASGTVIGGNATDQALMKFLGEKKKVIGFIFLRSL